MRVVFIYFDFMKGAGGKYYEGIASISAVLSQNNHVTTLFHITDYVNCINVSLENADNLLL